MLDFVKNAARQAIEKPDFGKAFFYFLLPFILQLIILAIIGVAINFSSIAFGGFLEIANWLLGAVALYLIIYFFKGKEVSGKFKGILAGLGFRYVFLFFLMLLVFLVLFIGIPEFFPIVAGIPSAKSGSEAFNLIGESLQAISQKNDFLLFSIFGIILIGTVIALVLSLLLVFELISLSGSGSSSKNLLILLVWVAVQAIIGLFL